MSEKSGLWNLSLNDFVKSAISSAFVAGFVVIAGTFSAEGFNVFKVSLDQWVTIGQGAINASLIVFVSRVVEKFTTAPNGKVFGVIGMKPKE